MAILVAEDERKLNDVIRDYLGSLGYATRAVFDGPAAVEACAEEPPELVVLDLMLPRLDGIETAKRIREKHDVPILMLTARDSEADKLLGLEVGADDYMTKPFSVRELGARIRAILRRVTRPERSDLAARGVAVDPERHRVTRDGREVAVTPAQFELLRVLLGAPGRVFSRKELIEQTTGYVYEGYERTMDVHVKNLRKVLEEDPAHPRRIVTVRGVGYKFEE